MLEWLTGRKNRRELPEYSHLRDVPSDLAHEESGDMFASKQMAIEEELRQTHFDPEGDTPHFTALIVPGGRGVVTIPMPNGGRQCLPALDRCPRCSTFTVTGIGSLKTAATGVCK